MSRQTHTTEHQEIIKELSEEGAETKGFAVQVRKMFAIEDDGFIDDRYKKLPMRPDAWKLGKTMRDGDTIIAYEVQVAHHVCKDKMQCYTWLWFEFDATSGFYLDLVLIDRFGHRTRADLRKQWYIGEKRQIADPLST